jgi:hypothetical protein
MAPIASPTYAQFAAGDKVLDCLVSGKPVETVKSRSLKSPAYAAVVKGRRTILINPLIMQRYPPLVQMFLYARECGRQIAKPSLSMMLHKGSDPEAEKAADRIGIRLLRDRLHISLQDAEGIATALSDLLKAALAYSSGSETGKWIVDCFKTGNDTCTE